VLAGSALNSLRLGTGVRAPGAERPFPERAQPPEPAPDEAGDPVSALGTANVLVQSRAFRQRREQLTYFIIIRHSQEATNDRKTPSF
jgi:hypothetical protein